MKQKQKPTRLHTNKDWAVLKRCKQMGKQCNAGIQMYLKCKGCVIRVINVPISLQQVFYACIAITAMFMCKAISIYFTMFVKILEID